MPESGESMTEPGASGGAYVRLGCLATSDVSMGCQGLWIKDPHPCLSLSVSLFSCSLPNFLEWGALPILPFSSPMLSHCLSVFPTLPLNKPLCIRPVSLYMITACTSKCECNTFLPHYWSDLSPGSPQCLPRWDPKHNLPWTLLPKN